MATLDFTPIPDVVRIARGQSLYIPIRLQENLTGNLNDYTLKAFLLLNNTVIDTLTVSSGITVATDGRSMSIKKDFLTLTDSNAGTSLTQLLTGTLQIQLFASDSSGKDSLPLFFNIEIVEAPDTTTQRVSADGFVFILKMVDGFLVSLATDNLYNLTVEKAGQAVEARNEAVSAKDLSVTARNESVSAKDASITAKNDSVTARNESVTAKNESVTAKNESVSARNESVAAKEIAEAKAAEAIATLPQNLGKFTEGLSANVDEDDNLLSLFTSEGKLRALFDYALSKITFNDLASDLAGLFANIPNSTGFFRNGRYLFVDDDDNLLGELTDEGKLKAFFDFALSKITYNDLTSDLQSSLPSFDSNAFVDYLIVYVDEADNILSGVKKDASLIAVLQLVGKIVTEANLTDSVLARLPDLSFLRRNTYNSADVEFSEDDDLWRGSEVELPVKTHRTGIAYIRFAPMKTQSVRGVNSTGTTLEFRTNNNLTIRGEKYIADFTPILASKLITDKGIFYYSATTLPANPTSGDYYICSFFSGNATTRTVQGVTMSKWDILYYDGTSWQVQPSPALASTLKEGDYFDVISDGKFWNIPVSSGDRIIYIGLKALAGNSIPIFCKQKDGEYFIKGECNPSTFSVASPKNNDLYIVSADGAYGGVDLKKGDYLFRMDGVWGKQEGNIVTIANNTAYSFACTNAKQIAVRRADKSATQLTMKAKASINMLSRRAGDNILLISDSMFGKNIGAAISSLLSTRTCVIQSFGGGTSENILSMYKYFIRNSDPYKNFKPVFFHGQNNNTDTLQIKKCALEMVSLAGSQQSDFIMWSMLGQLILTFNGTRLVCPNHEDAFNRANNSRFVEIEDWYDAVLKDRHFATRKAAIASAVGRTRKSLHFPGMTEEQVANTYGIPPLSYFFNFTAAGIDPNNLNFLNYHNTTSLPSNSSGSNLDYYIRIGGGSSAETVGNIILKKDGAWIEYTSGDGVFDNTHVTTEGANAIALQFQNFLNNKNF